MNVLITGASSLLGKALLQTCPRGANLTQTWFSNYVGIPMYQMNVCDKLQTRYIFDRCKPDLVIHCAAIGSVDYAEQHPQEVHEVNVNGTLNVLDCCRRHGARLVYISTNAVYDGQNPPYSETADRRPINRYGAIKKEAEDRVMEYDDWVIVRPFLLFGWTYAGARKNWVGIVLESLFDGRPLKLVNDVYWQPTLAEEVARVIWQVAVRPEPRDAYNVASPDRLTLYEFGRLIAKTWNLRPDSLVPASASEFSAMAPRPVDTTYDTSKLTRLGLKVNTTEEGLKGMR